MFPGQRDDGFGVIASLNCHTNTNLCLKREIIILLPVAEPIGADVTRCERSYEEKRLCPLRHGRVNLAGFSRVKGQLRIDRDRIHIVIGRGVRADVRVADTEKYVLSWRANVPGEAVVDSDGFIRLI